MINLAGDADCDRTIRTELTRAGIPIVESYRAAGEVPFSVVGKLGEFSFRRAWRYWVVNGPLPLRVALELYADPIGRTDVRVAGHCGCPPPERPWVHYYDQAGKQLALDEDGFPERAQFERMIALGHVTREQFEKYHWVDTRAELEAETARALVETYHIDTESGLRLFADTLRRHELT